MTFACHHSENIHYPNGAVHFRYEKTHEPSMRKVTEYDMSGNIIAIFYENEFSQIDSISKYFDEYGHLTSMVFIKNGMRNGESRWYYPNGQIEQSVLFVNDQRTGEHCFYNEDGRLRRSEFYKIINGQSFLNAALTYDENDNIMNLESHYAEIFMDLDTICYGNSIEYEIGWVCDNETYVRALTGNIDHNFNVCDSSSLKQVNLGLPNYYLPTQTGSDTLRIIFEYKKHQVINGVEKEYRGKTYLDKIFYVTDCQQN